MMFRFLILLLLMPLWAFGQENGPMIVNIDNPNFRKLIVAIPKFVPKTNKPQLRNDAASGAEGLAKLLTYSGLFNVISEKAYADLLDKLKQNINKVSPKVLGVAGKGGIAGVDLQQWKALGVESLTIGEIDEDDDGLILELRTIDINRQELILGKKYTKVKAKEYNLVLRRYADLLLRAYTGKPGIFSSKLVFVGKRSKKSDKQIYISDFDGSNLIQVTKGRYPHLSPTWSHDGRFVTFTSYRDRNPDLFIYELATGGTRKLSGSKGLNSGSNWSPDDKIVAFTGSVSGDANIYYIEPSGGKRRVLIRGGGLDVDPAFSPDKRWLAFVSGRYGNPHIFRAQLEWESPTKVKVLGDKRLTYAGWYNATPAWSPDGKKLAFAGYDRDIDRFDLFLMNPDGKNLERLTLRAGDNESPSWSPNGQMIIFHSNRIGKRNVKGGPNLYIMNRDGSNQRKLDTGLYESQTAKWSPALD